MYVLVPYNLSEIQKGIQAAHAIAEMAYYDDYEYPGITQWVTQDKTIIILNGGTTGNNSTLYQYCEDIKRMNMKVSLFREPDLNNALTAVAFIVDMEEDTHVIGYLKQMGLA